MAPANVVLADVNGDLGIIQFQQEAAALQGRIPLRLAAGWRSAVYDDPHTPLSFQPSRLLIIYAYLATEPLVVQTKSALGGRVGVSARWEVAFDKTAF